MKKLIRRLILIVVLTTSILPTTSGFAATDWLHVHPPYYRLTEITPLYDSPIGLPVPTGADISPQTVKVLDNYASTQSNPEWFKIDTWLGEKWINAGKGVALSEPEPIPFTDTPSFRYGAMDGRTDTRTFLELRSKTKVYDKAGDTMPIATLAPQELEVKVAYGQYSTPLGTWYLAETWLGDKWLYAVRPIIRPFNDSIKTFPREGGTGNFYSISNIIEVAGALYDEPFEDTKTSYSLATQKVEVIDYGNDFYKIRTWVGDKWIRLPYKHSPKV
jgi:hypothetical protein